MSDAPQGPGWWQASDDKWYPPPRPEMPGDEAATQPYTSTAPAETVPQAGYAQAPPTTPYGTTSPLPGTAAPVPGAPPPGAPGVPGAPHSPYGVPPVVPPPPSGDNRTPLFVALGVLGTAALVGVMLVAFSGDDDDPPTSSTTTAESTSLTTEPTDDTVPTDDPLAPPANGELAVREHNYSISFDQLYETDALSYGFVVENTTDQVAVGVNAAIAFKDQAGTVIGTDEELVNVLLPGATFGIGDAGVEVDGEPATMEVTIAEPSSWESPDDFGEITVSGINTTIDDYGAPTTAFTAASTYGEQLDSPYAYVIYRNAAGDIIGGAWGTMPFLQPNGSTTGEIDALNTIDDIDDTKTEVYVDAGFLS